MFRKLRNDFFAGLLVVVPITISIWIFWSIFNLFDDWYRRLAKYYGIHDTLSNYGYFMPEYGVGFVLTIALITFIGFITQLYLGKKLLEFVDFIFYNIPGISTIYTGLKQVSDTLMGKKHKIFDAVTLVEYPRKGMYSLGFVIGRDKNLVEGLVGKRSIYVFVATTPNPTSGFFLIVPEEDTIPLDISVEDAMKMIISSGMVSPTGTNPIDKYVHSEKLKVEETV
ncbi:MAG: DUF502 domain-containing protein [bacterium]|jgi:uncharacterized membrane protein